VLASGARVCRACQRIRAADHYARNPERVREIARASYWRCKNL
jgi:hypothetical protein